MSAVEVVPISDVFAMGVPEVEVLGDFARLTFWSDQEVEGETFQVTVAKIIVPVEAVMAILRPAAPILPFSPRVVA
jgi:hypothetical protein